MMSAGFGACLAADLEPCTDAVDRGNGGRAVAERYDVIISVSTGDLQAAPATGPVTLEGRVDANIRVDRLLVGDQLVTGTQPNYGEWNTEVSLETLESFRDGEWSELMVEAFDVCERHYEGDAVRVRVSAPEGSAAPGLRVDSTPVQAITSSVPECYLPADGSGQAVIEVRADAEAAGVEVTLATAVNGTLLGAADRTVVLGAGESGGSIARVFFQPIGAGLLGVSASAGPSFALDDNRELRAVGAPTFSGADGALPRDIPVQVMASTDGRLARCTASSSRPDVVSVRASGSGSADLLSQALVLGQNATCGQAQALTVTFEANAPTGVSVEIACEDTYGQAGVRRVSVE